MPNSSALIKTLRNSILIVVCLIIGIFSLNINFLDYIVLNNRPVDYVNGLKTLHIIANIFLISALLITGILFIRLYNVLKKHKVAYSGFLWLFGVLKLSLALVFIMNFIGWWRVYFWIDGIIRLGAGIIAIGSMISFIQVYKFLKELRTPVEYEKLAEELEALRKIQEEAYNVKITKSKK